MALNGYIFNSYVSLPEGTILSFTCHGVTNHRLRDSSLRCCSDRSNTRRLLSLPADVPKNRNTNQLWSPLEQMNTARSLTARWTRRNNNVRNQLRTKSTMTKQYSVAVAKSFYLPTSNQQHRSVSGWRTKGVGPTMQVWQTVSSSRQRARNAERITKKPLGHAPGRDLLWCGQCVVLLVSQFNMFLHVLTCFDKQTAWLQIIWESLAAINKQLPWIKLVIFRMVYHIGN